MTAIEVPARRIHRVAKTCLSVCGIGVVVAACLAAISPYGRDERTALWAGVIALLSVVGIAGTVVGILIWWVREDLAEAVAANHKRADETVARFSVAFGEMQADISSVAVEVEAMRSQLGDHLKTCQAEEPPTPAWVAELRRDLDAIERSDNVVDLEPMQALRRIQQRLQDDDR